MNKKMEGKGTKEDTGGEREREGHTKKGRKNYYTT
jgi:hypothetical protein